MLCSVGSRRTLTVRVDVAFPCARQLALKGVLHPFCSPKQFGGAPRKVLVDGLHGLAAKLQQPKLADQHPIVFHDDAVLRKYVSHDG